MDVMEEVRSGEIAPPRFFLVGRFFDSLLYLAPTTYLALRGGLDGALDDGPETGDRHDEETEDGPEGGLGSCREGRTRAKERWGRGPRGGDKASPRPVRRWMRI